MPDYAYPAAPAADIPATRRERKADAAARSWHHDPQLEAVNRLRDSDAAAFASMAPATKIAVGFYLAAKAAASAAGRDVTR